MEVIIIIAALALILGIAINKKSTPPSATSGVSNEAEKPAGHRKTFKENQ